MKEPKNLANAVVIIAAVYFLTQVSGIWPKIGLFFILFFALATWGIWTNPFKKQEEELLNRRIEETEARTRNLNSHSAFISAQAATMMENLKWLKRRN